MKPPRASSQAPNQDLVLGARAEQLADDVVAVGPNRVGVYVAAGGRLRCIASRGYEHVHDAIPPGIGILGMVWVTGVSHLVLDPTSEPAYLAVDDTGLAEACLPLVIGGEVQGVVNVEGDPAVLRASQDAVVALTTAFADEIVPDELRWREDAWERLARLGERLALAEDLNALLRVAVDGAVGLTGGDAALVVSTVETQRRVVTAGDPDLLACLDDQTRARLARWAAGCAIVRSVGVDHDPSAGVGDHTGVGRPRWLALPLAADRPEELLVVGWRDDAPLEPHVVAASELLVRHLRAGAARLATSGRERRRAMIDPLTGLGHHGGFHQHLRAADADGDAGVAVVLVDLDGFKTYNDQWGHVRGDALLRAAASAMQHELEGRDAVYRLGGDEFGAIVRVPDVATGRRVADRLLHALRDVGAKASVGVVHRAPGVALPAGELVAQADVAMYAAKQDGGGRVQVYAADLRREHESRRELVEALPGALERGQLRLAFQPVVDAQRKVCLGAEALLRWQHPTLGEIEPEVFVPLLERERLIGTVGHWVLRTAAAQAAEWNDRHPRALKLGINVSGLQLVPTFPAQVAATLRDVSLAADLLVVELTESSLADASGVRVLREVRDLGVAVVVDDFGTGWSSLSQLARLPVDALKVDRTFTWSLHEREGRAVVATVCQLGRSLDLGVVAEGVETRDQADALLALGATMQQGNLHGRPMAAEDLLTFAASYGYGLVEGLHEPRVRGAAA